MTSGTGNNGNAIPPTAPTGTTEYQLFVRCISDQTVVENDKRRLRTMEDGTMNSSALQNPSDPDATYRNKSGKSYRGYAANIEETVGKNGSVVTDYQFDKNTHTDSHFLQKSLSAMEKSEEEIILVTDGGYDGQDNVALAKEKNVKLVTTALIGKGAPDALADFEFNEDGTRLVFSYKYGYHSLAPIGIPMVCE